MALPAVDHHRPFKAAVQLERLKSVRMASKLAVVM
jgi:hypothetical protein